MSQIALHLKPLLKSQKFKVILGAIFLGVLSPLAFEPFNFPILGWICIWPLYWAAKQFRNSIPKLIGFGALCSLVLCFAGFHWLMYTMVNFAGLPWILAIIIFIPYSFLLNLKIPLFLMLFGVAHRKKIRSKIGPKWLIVGLVGSLSEVVAPQIFPWYWGNMVAGNKLIVQSADLFGILGITFVYFSITYALFRIAVSILRGRSPTSRIYKLKRKVYWKRTIAMPILLVAVLTYGVIQKARFESIQLDLPKLNVLMLQPNAPLEKAGENKVTESALSRLIREEIPQLADEAYEKSEGRVDLVILPESAIPYFSADDSQLSQLARVYSKDFDLLIRYIAYKFNAEVYFNEIGLGLKPRLEGGQRIVLHNSSALYGRDGQRHSIYHKRILVAFGEYIPLLSIFEGTGLIQFIPEAVRYSRFESGPTAHLLPYTISNSVAKEKIPSGLPLLPEQVWTKEPTDFTRTNFGERVYVPTGGFIPLICYEVLFPQGVRDFFEENTKNPDFLVNITQDKWYGESVESMQHFELGRLRAVETRRALVRSTNSGISGMVDLAGNYAPALVGPTLTAQEAKDFQIFEVPIGNASRTVYSRFGELWLLIPSLAFLVLLIRRKRKR